ncbi:MAG: branched-chain amino acid ABC transporter permease [Acidimicrobiia bacterium]|nr:branched-chain amino acid ABC transporter permease [Acidimicrobiia bacterium]
MSDVTTQIDDVVDTIDEITKGAFDVDWRRIVRSGNLLGLSMVFIALSGMPVGLDEREVIDGVISLGYLALLLSPPIFGWNVGKEVVLEGMTATKRGARDIVAGAAVGAIGGLWTALLVVLVDNFNLRDPLVNWSPDLLSMLTFGRSIGFGVVMWVVLSALVAAAGAGLHLLAPRIRRAVMVMVLTVIGVSIFQSLIDDLVGGVGESIADPGRLSEFFGEGDTPRPRVDSVFDGLIDFIYAQRGGLTIAGAIVLALISGGLSLSGRGRIAKAKASYNAKSGPERTRQTSIMIAITAVLLIVLPFFMGRITQDLLANVGIFLLLALGLNIVVGLAGILDLGYVAFFAVGSYSVAVLTVESRPESWPDWMPTLNGPFLWLVAMLITVVICGLVGLFIGAPVIRMRGDYLAIVTLGFGEIIRLLFLSDWLGGYFNAAQGITQIPGADFGPLGEATGTSPRSIFYLVLFFAAISIYVSWRLERSRIGRAWMAVREDESVAEAMGINTVNVKLMAFVVGAVLASFAGAITSVKVGSVFPTSFLILVSIIILVVVIVGGMGNILGVIAGSFVLIGVLGGPRQPGLLSEFSEYKLLIYGALLIWMMLQRPEGLIPNVRRSRELHQDEFLQDAWLKGEVDSDEDDEALATEVAPS